MTIRNLSRIIAVALALLLILAACAELELAPLPAANQLPTATSVGDEEQADEVEPDRTMGDELGGTATNDMTPGMERSEPAMMAVDSADNALFADIARRAGGYGAENIVQPNLGLLTLVGKRDEAQAVAILAAQPDVAAHLAAYDTWSGEAWAEDDSTLWYVDLYHDASEEWLGWGAVDVADKTVTEFFVPRDVSAEELQVGQARIARLIAADAAIQMRLGDSAEWDSDIGYDRWDGSWYAWFGRGLEEFVVVVYSDADGALFIDSIFDPLALDAQEQREWAHSQAIELAYESDGLWDVLSDTDDWTTYAEDQGDGVWTVAFVTRDGPLFSAVVDVDAWQIVATEP